MKFKLTTQTALACLLCLTPAFAQNPVPSVAPPPPPAAPEPPQALVEIAQTTPAVPPVPPTPAALPALAQAEAALAQAEDAEAKAEGRIQQRLEQHRVLAQAEDAEAQAEDVFKQVAPADSTVIFGGNRHPSPLLIDSGEIKDPKQRGALIEDLNVMHRILAKAASSVAGGARQPTAMGIAVFAGAQPGPDTLYISGFGPVFLLDVKFPLLGPPRDEAEKPAEANPKDSTWEETKRELYGPPQPPGGGMTEAMMRRYGLGRGTPGREPLAFDAGRVESLKVALLKALKNAGNIHELQPEDTLVVVVRGAAGRQISSISNDELQRELPVGTTVHATGYVATYAAPASTLTVRVKSADISAFAGDKLSLDEFTKKADIAIY